MSSLWEARRGGVSTPLVATYVTVAAEGGHAFVLRDTSPGPGAYPGQIPEAGTVCVQEQSQTAPTSPARLIEIAVITDTLNHKGRAPTPHPMTSGLRYDLFILGLTSLPTHA